MIAAAKKTGCFVETASIPGTRYTMRKVSRDGKLTPQGQRLAKLLDRALPDEKVDEWGWNLSRRERAAIKRRAAEKRAADETRRRGAD